jgi:Zinc knuckle
VTHQFDTKRNVFLSLLDARIAYHTCKQPPHQTNAEYLEIFTSHVQVLEYYKATVGESYLLIDDDNGMLNVATRTLKARGCTIAMAFLRGADARRYANLWSDLANQQTRGNDQYPTDLTEAYALLVNYHTPNQARQQQQANAQTIPTTTVSNVPTDIGAHTFTQNAKVTSASSTSSTAKSTVKDGISCYNCGKPGHYSHSCPNPTVHGVSLVQYAYILTQHNTVDRYEGIPNHWILLDSQSSASVFNNQHMLSNVCDSDKTMCAQTNGGHQCSSKVGDFKNLGLVWFNPQSIANILALSEVRKVCRVTMDTTLDLCMVIHRTDGSQMKFSEHSSGLYYYDAHSTTSDSTNDVSIDNCTLVNTVSKNKQPFVTREIELADTARELYRKLGRPSEQQFEDILKKNLILNCPVTADDAKRAMIIYGPDLATIKGKTTRGDPTPHVPSFNAVPILAPILEHHKDVTLCVDFFFVQGQAFIHSISRKIQYLIVNAVPDRTKGTILKHIDKALRTYRNRGFNVTDLHCDNECECIREHLLPINLNIVAADAHVGEVERSIRTIKERNRSTVHGLPFRRLTKLLVREIVKHSVISLNQLPANDGVSDTLRPLTIMTGQSNPDFTKLRVEFGSYVQIFEPTTFATNTLRSRTTGAIALNATGNTQGDFHFMSLITRRRISRHQWTAVPMTESAIDRVQQMAAAEDQPWIQSTGLLVEWRPNAPFDDDDDPDYVYTNKVDDGYDDDDYDWDDLSAGDLTISTDNLSNQDTMPPSIA